MFKRERKRIGRKYGISETSHRMYDNSQAVRKK